MTRAAERRAAAARAVALIADGMVVGLGTGDTASYAVRALAGRDVVGVPTSRATAALAASVGLRLVEPDLVSAIDVTIDGADEIDGALRLIKGAGGALVRERLVARASRRLVIVADFEKRVTRLGEKRRLPVEVLPFGASWTIARLAALGLAPVLQNGISDGGGRLVDCVVPEGVELATLAAAIKAEPGVVDHGLFLDEASVVFVGYPGRVEELRRSPQRPRSSEIRFWIAAASAAFGAKRRYSSNAATALAFSPCCA